MANTALRLPENIPGDFFVDSTCIDCDACCQIAPETFTDAGDASIVLVFVVRADTVNGKTSGQLFLMGFRMGAAGPWPGFITIALKTCAATLSAVLNG